MKAVEVRVPGGPDALTLVDLPLPEPQAGEVRVAARAIGAGKPDTLIRDGSYAWMPPLPAIPGNEMAGVVDAVGTGVTALPVGTRVLVSARELVQRGGCYAQAICVPADAPFVLPDAIAFEDAVTLANVQLALALLGCGGASARSILVPGAAGGVASVLSQVARSRGMLVIGTASSESKRAAALEHGAHHAIDGDAVTLPARVAALTNDRGVDIAFDHVGGALFVACLHALAPMGTLVSYNTVSGPPDIDVFAEMRRRRAMSPAVRVFSMHTLDADRAHRRALMHEAIELMARADVRAPRATHFPLRDVQRVHELLERGAFGKIVIDP